MQIAEGMKEGVLVALLPDGGDRYLSTNLFTTMLESDFRFYNLLERQKVEFKPVKEGKARICVTGPPLDQSLSISEMHGDFCLPTSCRGFSRRKIFGR